MNLVSEIRHAIQTVNAPDSDTSHAALDVLYLVSKQDATGVVACRVSEETMLIVLYMYTPVHIYITLDVRVHLTLSSSINAVVLLFVHCPFLFLLSFLCFWCRRVLLTHW